MLTDRSEKGAHWLPGQAETVGGGGCDKGDNDGLGGKSTFLPLVKERQEKAKVLRSSTLQQLPKQAAPHNAATLGAPSALQPTLPSARDAGTRFGFFQT